MHMARAIAMPRIPIAPMHIKNVFKEPVDFFSVLCSVVPALRRGAEIKRNHEGHPLRTRQVTKRKLYKG